MMSHDPFSPFPFPNFKVGLVSLHRVLEEQEEEDFGQVRGVCPSFAILVCYGVKLLSYPNTGAATGGLLGYLFGRGNTGYGG